MFTKMVRRVRVKTVLLQNYSLIFVLNMLIERTQKDILNGFTH